MIMRAIPRSQPVDFECRDGGHWRKPALMRAVGSRIIQLRAMDTVVVRVPEADLGKLYATELQFGAVITDAHAVGKGLVVSRTVILISISMGGLCSTFVT